MGYQKPSNLQELLQHLQQTSADAERVALPI